MSIIKELESKLRGAQRALKKALRDQQEVLDIAADHRKEVQRREARVRELESALSLLRNGMRAPTAEVGSGNVTQLKPR